MTMAWYWYPILVLAIYAGGVVTGALVWRKNAKRFSELEAQGKRAVLDLTGKGK